MNPVATIKSSAIQIGTSGPVDPPVDAPIVLVGGGLAGARVGVGVGAGVGVGVGAGVGVGVGAPYVFAIEQLAVAPPARTRLLPVSVPPVQLQAPAV